MDGYSIADIESFAALMYSVPIDDLYLVPYAYPIDFESFLNGSTRSGIINLSANADFIALGLRHFIASDEIGDPTVMSKCAGDVRCLITDTSSGDQFTNGAASLENYSTNGMGEKLFEFPRLLAGRGALSVQVVNNTGADINVMQLMIHGVLVRSWTDRPASKQAAGG